MDLIQDYAKLLSAIDAVSAIDANYVLKHDNRSCKLAIISEITPT